MPCPQQAGALAPPPTPRKAERPASSCKGRRSQAPGPPRAVQEACGEWAGGLGWTQGPIEPWRLGQGLCSPKLGGHRTHGLGAWSPKQCLEKGVSDRWDAHAAPTASKQLGQPGPAAASPAPVPLPGLELSAAHLNSPQEDTSCNSTPQRLERWRSFMSHKSALTVLSQLLTETMSSQPQ